MAVLSICCPSRAELLGGRYFHNLRVATHNAPGGCMQANLTKVTHSLPSDPTWWDPMSPLRDLTPTVADVADLR